MTRLEARLLSTRFLGTTERLLAALEPVLALSFLPIPTFAFGTEDGPRLPLTNLSTLVRQFLEAEPEKGDLTLATDDEAAYIGISWYRGFGRAEKSPLQRYGSLLPDSGRFYISERIRRSDVFA